MRKRYRSSPTRRSNGNPSPQTRAFTEPREFEDPLNAALDAAEQLIRNIVSEGGEAPLRTRLKRLLPTADPIGGSEVEMVALDRARDQALGTR